VKEITELIQEREGAYNDYQDASALKYSHVQATARYDTNFSDSVSSVYFPLLETLSEKIRKRMVYGAC